MVENEKGLIGKKGGETDLLILNPQKQDLLHDSQPRHLPPNPRFLTGILRQISRVKRYFTASLKS